MIQALRLRISAIWLLLVVATCVSWEAVQDFAWLKDTRFAAAAVMIIAFIKVRFIVLDFMELRHAPVAARVFAEAWIVLVCAGILGLYWFGGAQA